MRQEIEPIQQLEQRRKELSNKIGQRESLVSTIGTDKVWIGSSSEGGALDKVLVGSSFEATLKVGQARKTVRGSVGGLKDRLSRFDQEAEPIIRQHAQDYLNIIALKRGQLAEISELVAEGNLSEVDLIQHQQEFEELVKLRETNPLLKREIEKIEEDKKESQKEKPQDEAVKPDEDERDIEPKVFKLPNREEIGGKTGEALTLLQETSENNLLTVSQIGQAIYGTGDNHIKQTVRSLMERVIQRVDGSGVKVVKVYHSSCNKHRVQVILGYYMINQEESEFQFEDGEVVAGEVGRLLKNLSPFDPHHIVSSQELSGEGISDQYLQEARSTLFAKGFRLAQIPNLKDPDNVGFYVETYRPPDKITVLGDTIRYKDRDRGKEGQEKQIRLTEEQSNLLWVLSSGEPKAASLDLANAVSSLNTELADVTGIEETIVSVGDENFGYWYKAKDISITYRVKYLPLYSSRKEALKLIFQDDNATKERIINTLGLTRGIKRAPRLLDGHQALIALARSVVRLTNRMSENIATEDEASIFQNMQGYMAKHNLKDRRELINYIREKLGAPPRTSNIDTDLEDVEDFTDEEEASNETPKFGSLSNLDISLIAQRIQHYVVDHYLNRQFLEQRGIKLIDSEILYKLIDITEGQQIEWLKEMSLEDLTQFVKDYEATAFGRAKEMLKSSDFTEMLESIYGQNPDVWSLLFNLSEINEFIEKGGIEEGISILAQDSESLEEIFSQIEKENEEGKPTDESRNGEQNGQKLIALERRDTAIRATINIHLDTVLGILGSFDNDLTVWGIGSNFPKLSRSVIKKGLEERWISPNVENGMNRFNAVDIATLMYLGDNDNLPSRLKKQVRDIALEEYNKRLKGAYS